MSKKQIENDKLCYALLVSPTQEAAAKMLNCSRNYISERRQQPEFQAIYRSFKEELLNKTTEQLIVYNLDAINALHRLLDDANSSVQVAAAKSILTYSKDFYMLSDLQKRIEQLEQIEADA